MDWYTHNSVPDVVGVIIDEAVVETEVSVYVGGSVTVKKLNMNRK